MGIKPGSTPTAGASSPPATLDSRHPATGDCGNCHTTAPTFALDVPAGKPSNHIPTTARCVQCHTTTGDYTLYSSPGTHQGLTGCQRCHGPRAAAAACVAPTP